MNVTTKKRRPAKHSSGEKIMKIYGSKYNYTDEKRKFWNGYIGVEDEDRNNATA